MGLPTKLFDFIAKDDVADLATVLVLLLFEFGVDLLVVCDLPVVEGALAV